MKAYKCPKCGKFNRVGILYCIDCDYMLIDEEEVEIIDWEKELLTKTEEK